MILPDSLMLLYSVCVCVLYKIHYIHVNKGTINGMPPPFRGLLMLFPFSGGLLSSLHPLWHKLASWLIVLRSFVILSPQNNNPATLFSELRFFSENWSVHTSMGKTKDLNVLSNSPHPILPSEIWAGTVLLVGLHFILYKLWILHDLVCRVR